MTVENIQQQLLPGRRGLEYAGLEYPLQTIKTLAHKKGIPLV